MAHRPHGWDEEYKRQRETQEGSEQKEQGQGIPPGRRVYRAFEEARDYVRSQGLKNSEEWRRWARSGARPANIPANPEQVYKDLGWRGRGDWLGRRPDAPQ